jgi:hypothetical protein
VSRGLATSIAVGALIASTALPISAGSTSRQERPFPSACLWPCRECQSAAKGERAAEEACWRASATCCLAIGRKPVLRACGCW